MNYKSRVRITTIILLVLFIDGMYGVLTEHRKEIDELNEMVDIKRAALKESELIRMEDKQLYSDSLVMIVDAVYTSDLNKGGYAILESTSSEALRQAIMNDLLDYRELLDNVDNYFDSRKDYLSKIPCIWPIHFSENTLITSGFGWRVSPITGRVSYHAGIDIVGDVEIIATADGVVDDNWIPPGMHWGMYFSGHEELGGCITIDHPGGYRTVYGHLKESNVTEGQEVKRGDIIGIMGNTGHSTGRHLHYEVRLNGEPVNPLELLRF
jgi:murein DD-endopeptidase MepM/ murein hydrolase activator NlpD